MKYNFTVFTIGFHISGSVYTWKFEALKVIWVRKYMNILFWNNSWSYKIFHCTKVQQIIFPKCFHFTDQIISSNLNFLKYLCSTSWRNFKREVLIWKVAFRPQSSHRPHQPLPHYNSQGAGRSKSIYLVLKGGNLTYFYKKKSTKYWTIGPV